MKPEKFTINVAYIVEALRDLRGIKQFELADALGIDRSNYSRLENGHRPFNVAELKIVAEKLNTTVLQIILLADTSVIIDNKLEPLSKILYNYLILVRKENPEDVLSVSELSTLINQLKRG